MKRHPRQALTAGLVEQIQRPGRYADGVGLYLVVDDSLAKRWMWRGVVQGRRRDIGLGGTTATTLARARQLAARYRRQAREGQDPLVEKQASEHLRIVDADAGRALVNYGGPHQTAKRRAIEGRVALMKLEGYGYRRIAAALNEAGLVTIYQQPWTERAVEDLYERCKGRSSR